MATDIVAAFADLFEGRHDAYGTADGGCVRVQRRHLDNTPEGFTHWHAMARDHLEGVAPIGVYPMVQKHLADFPYVDSEPTWCVKWGCVDFDVQTKGKPSWDYATEEIAHIAAVNLQLTLRQLGVSAWIERTRSLGRHVWVFASSWVAAPTMRRALLVAATVAGVSAREVNPKQETLAEGQLGNYVRLPYPGGLIAPTRPTQAVIDGHRVMTLTDFAQNAIALRTSPDVLEKIAARWQEPTSAIEVHVEAAAYDGSLDVLVKFLNKPALHVFLNGPADGDRSNGLSYFAYQCRLSGLTPELAMVLVENLDARLGKFVGRQDRDKRLSEVVGRAWE